LEIHERGAIEYRVKNIIGFIRNETVLCAALVLAVISAFVIPPDEAYADYIDFRTLSILFCLMAVMAGFQKIGVFESLAQALLKRVKSIRQMVWILIMLCFFSGMLITNDVALITFVPFTFIVLNLLGEEEKKHWMIPIVTMQHADTHRKSAKSISLRKGGDFFWSIYKIDAAVQSVGIWTVVGLDRAWEGQQKN
jgi:di/tricarboxylate transporter